MNIFLLGFMGSGKSTLGKKIAKFLDYDFIDLDVEIEKETNMSISEVFEEKGETYFRELECKWLANFDGDNYLIALGGGTVCFNSNIDHINKIGVSVYLKMSVSALTKRLTDSKTKRPLIEKYKNNSEKLNSEIMQLLSERELYYNQAQIVFEATNMSKSKIEELTQLISTYA